MTYLKIKSKIKLDKDSSIVFFWKDGYFMSKITFLQVLFYKSQWYGIMSVVFDSFCFTEGGCVWLEKILMKTIILKQESILELVPRIKLVKDLVYQNKKND